MIEAAAAYGYDLTQHRCRILGEGLLAWSDGLIAVDDETALTVEALAGPDRPVRILGPGIADPWGGGPEDFARAVLETRAAAAVLRLG